MRVFDTALRKRPVKSDVPKMSHNSKRNTSNPGKSKPEEGKNMDSYSNSSSDLDDELPVFDFLSQTSLRHKSSPDGSAPTCSHQSAVMMVSSGSDDEAPYVPLAQRLKQRQDNTISASSCTLSTKDTESQPLCSLSIRHQLPRHQKGVANLPLPKRKHAMCSVEEIQASREEVLKSSEATERVYQDRELLQQEKERGKSERKALAEAVKNLRPEECIKHMVVVVDPALLQQEGGETLLLSVRNLGCSCAIEKQPIPRSVSWIRRIPCAQSDDATCTSEPHVVMQMTVDDMVSLIHNYIQKERYGRCDCGPTLTSWVQEQQRRNPNKTLRVVVINLEKYLRSLKSQSQKFQGAVKGKDGGTMKRRRKNGGVETLPEVSRVEIEEAIVHLQLHTGVSVCFFSTWKDFSDHIAMTTKAVAEVPFKHQKEKTGFSFCLESEWVGGQRVDKSGKGLLHVWKRQIQQLNRVSQDMASAILAAYPSPQLLRKVYNQCKSSDEKILLLSDLLIRRGAGITSTTRRVGPELSKRLYLTMNSCDPEQVLESNP